MSNELTSDISKWFDRKLWKSDAAAADDDPVDVLSPIQGAVGLRQMITRFLRNKKISDQNTYWAQSQNARTRDIPHFYNLK